MFEVHHDDAICITGGDGFLGRHLVRDFKQNGISNILVPKKEDYDLTQLSEIERGCITLHPEHGGGSW